MKLPKELRNKSKISTNDKKKQLHAIFRKTFAQLNNSQNSHYTIAFLKIGQKGEYSDLVYQRLGGNANLDKKDFIIMGKERENIELYVNWERLGKIYLKGKLYYDLDHNFEFFKKLYRQIAYHEYGHTFLISSSSTMFFPNEATQFLEDNNIRSLYDISEDKHAELERVLASSKQHLINLNLKNINFMDIANGVVECHANYSMRNVLKLKDPIEFLKFGKIDLLDGLYDYSKFDMNKTNKKYLTSRIYKWVIKANDLFIYDKLNIMKESCEKYGFLNLYNFAFDTNRKYLEIVKTHEELKGMKDAILTLAEETNKLDFIEKFFY